MNTRTRIINIEEAKPKFGYVFAVRIDVYRMRKHWAPTKRTKYGELVVRTILKSKANRTNEFYTNKNIPNSWFQNKYGIRNMWGEVKSWHLRLQIDFFDEILKPIRFGASSWYSLAFVYVTSICVSHGYECVSHAPRAHIIDFNLFLNRPISFHHTQAFIANTHTEFYTRHHFIRRFEFVFFLVRIQLHWNVCDTR